MKTLRQFMFTAIIIGSVLATATAAESFSVLLQKGIFAEETERNLDAAIKIYEQITAEAATNLSVVAQAQYRLGVCYQKKGSKDQAVAALRRLMATFPSEGALIEKAQALLRELGYAPSENIVIRRLSLSGVWPSSVSPDGRWTSHMQNDYKDLVVYDILSGESRTLVRGNAEHPAPDYCIFSPDGRQAAYSWDSATNLYVTDLESPAPKCIYHAEKGWTVWPNDWSADGRSLVLTLNHPTIAIRIGLLSIGSEAFREVAAIPRPDSLEDFRLKASGDLLAFQRRSTNESSAGIYVVQVPTGSQTKISARKDDELVGWDPGSTRLVFLSDRTGTRGLWTLECAGGKPTHDPELARPNMGNVYPLGIGGKGAIFYIERTTDTDVYLATVDFETGKVLSPPKRATDRFPGLNVRPIWSHNGQKLGFIRLPPNGTTLPDGFSVLTLKTGEQRDFSLAGKFVSPIQGMDWSHDETFLLLRAYRPDGYDGIYRYNLPTGRAEPLLTRNDHESEFGDWYGNPRISPDGKSFYYLRRKFLSEEPVRYSDSVYQHDWETGHDERVYESPESLSAWSTPTEISPDGKQLVVMTAEQGPKWETMPESIKIVPLGGGQVRTLVTAPPPAYFLCAQWTADGKRVVFWKVLKDDYNEIWSIPAAGGNPTRIELQLPRLSRFSNTPRSRLGLSPDGRQIALSYGSANVPSVWMMENALPGRGAPAK